MPISTKPTSIPITAAKTRLSWRDEWNWKRQLRRQNEKAHMLFTNNTDLWHSDLVIISDSQEPQKSDFWISAIELGLQNTIRIQGDYEEEILGLEEELLTKEDLDMLDLDFHIQTPPPSPLSGTIKVKFKYIGRSKPTPINDPWA